MLLSDDGEHPDAPVTLAGEYEELVDAASPGYEFADFDENTHATTFYTTGTTGNPKGVYFSHRQLVLHTIAALAALGTSAVQGRFHRADVYMPVTPMFHVHAWGVPYMATVMGVKQVYPGRYAPDVLLDLIEREGVTFSHCVPTILHMLLGAAEGRDVDLSGWTVVIGGSALPKGLARQAMELGIDILSGYGMSETGPVLTLVQLTPEMLEGGVDEQLEVRTKTGRPIPLVDLRVVDADMNDAPHDGKATGEVVVRAPWLTQGYLSNPDASAELWEGGYRHTKDIGTINESGYLQVTDRIKDVIKSGGEWVSSLLIEDIISRHEGVSEVAVVGVVDERWGERRGEGEPVRHHDRARLPGAVVAGQAAVQCGRGTAGCRPGAELRARPGAVRGSRAVWRPYPQPVGAGVGRAEGRARLLLTTHNAVEIDGKDKPAMVADLLALLIGPAAAGRDGGR